MNILTSLRDEHSDIIQDEHFDFIEGCMDEHVLTFVSFFTLFADKGCPIMEN